MALKSNRLVCWNCGAEAPWQPHCASCGALQRFPKELDYFTLFSLPRQPEVDLEDLQVRYYALSRIVHPDVHQGASCEECSASLENSAVLNRAHRTLKDPFLRGLYWLELHGEKLGADNNRVPPRLAAKVFEVQEQLEELRGGGDEARARIEELAREIRNELASTEGRFAANFRRFEADGEGSRESLAELKTILSETSYLKTLLRDVEKELDASWNESSAST